MVISELTNRSFLFSGLISKIPESVYHIILGDSNDIEPPVELVSSGTANIAPFSLNVNVYVFPLVLIVYLNEIPFNFEVSALPLASSSGITSSSLISPSGVSPGSFALLTNTGSAFIPEFACITASNASCDITSISDIPSSSSCFVFLTTLSN